MRLSTRLSAPLAALALAIAGPALAGPELSFYLGTQDAPHSRVKGSDPGGVGDYSFLVDWKGKSFSNPPYYGVRATWWRNQNLGFGVEFTHTKVYASDKDKRNNGFDTLEFTDGLNTLTANVMYRWPKEGRAWTPYVGGGLGIVIPHVEVTTAGGKTFEYQYGGPAARGIAGISYAFNDRWSAFGEYQFTASHVDVDLDNGGDLKTTLYTNALNFGVSYQF